MLIHRLHVFTCWFRVPHRQKYKQKSHFFYSDMLYINFEFTTNIKYLYYQHLLKQLVSQFIFIVQNSTHLRSFHLYFKSISKITSNSLVKINNNIRRKAFVHRTPLNINHELKILEYKL